MKINATARLKATQIIAETVSPKETSKLLQFLVSHLGNFTSKKTVQNHDPEQNVTWRFSDKSSIRLFSKTDRPFLGVSIDKGGYGADFYGKTTAQIIKQLNSHFVDGKSHFQVGPTISKVEAYQKLAESLNQ